MSHRSVLSNLRNKSLWKWSSTRSSQCPTKTFKRPSESLKNNHKNFWILGSKIYRREKWHRFFHKDPVFRPHAVISRLVHWSVSDVLVYTDDGPLWAVTVFEAFMLFTVPAFPRRWWARGTLNRSTLLHKATDDYNGHTHTSFMPVQDILLRIM